MPLPPFSIVLIQELPPIWSEYSQEWCSHLGVTQAGTFLRLICYSNFSLQHILFSSKTLSISNFGTFCTIDLRLFPFLLLTIFEKVACKLLRSLLWSMVRVPEYILSLF